MPENVSVKESQDVKKKESTYEFEGKSIKVVSHYHGTKTANKLLYEMAATRILSEPNLTNDGGG